MSFDSHIHSIYSREILDSRGYPTLETTVVTRSGFRGIVGIPGGTSIGKYEAVELRDTNSTRYQGQGVLQAVTKVNKVISPRLTGLDCLNQAQIDQTLLTLDQTPNKQNLGANSILSVSLANAVVAANLERKPLFRYLNEIFQTYLKTDLVKIPAPIIEMINGGKHAEGNLDFQEFHVIPVSNLTYTQALETGVNIYQTLKRMLSQSGGSTSVGYEGGFTPQFKTNVEAIQIILESIKETGSKVGVNLYLGLDIAASHFKSVKGYTIKDINQPLSTQDFINFLIGLHKKYHFLLLEDPLGEDDWEGWQDLNAKIGSEVLIVGDDLLATNPLRLKMAIEKKACAAILLKPNQIGTLSEFFAVAALARKNNIKTVVSHRSGETTDTFIADLAVAIQADYVKFGAPVRGERVAKYNRLLQIEAELPIKI